MIEHKGDTMCKLLFALLSTLTIWGLPTMANDDMLNEQMEEVASFFAGRVRGDHDVLLAQQLDRSKLDFSLESLRAVDEWLSALREAGADSNDPQAAETVIWAGAYVGEVIRGCANRPYTWKRYEDYMASQPVSVRNLIPYAFGTQFVLTSGGRGVTLPINKVGRFLEEGPENSLYFYAAGECRDA